MNFVYRNRFWLPQSECYHFNKKIKIKIEKKKKKKRNKKLLLFILFNFKMSMPCILQLLAKLGKSVTSFF